MIWDCKIVLSLLVSCRKVSSIPEAIISGTPILTNLKPASSDYIINYDLGIAKDNWNEMDMKLLVDKNEEYVGNCIKYREYFTNMHAAKLFLEIFGQKQFFNYVYYSKMNYVLISNFCFISYYENFVSE